jgi:hypothetical protein
MPQHQHFYLGLDLGQPNSHATLAVLEYALPYVEYRNPVTFALEHEFQQRRLAIRQIMRIPHGTVESDAAEQVRSKLFKITHQNYDCTLIVDSTHATQPVADLFHHLPARATLVPVVMIDNAGVETKGQNECRISSTDIVEQLQTLLRSGDLEIAPGLALAPALFEELREHLGGPIARAAALAAWRARQHQDLSHTSNAPRTAPFGWGRVPLF